MTNLAKVGYEAYAKHANNKSLVSGRDLPPWEEVKPAIKEAWEVSASAIAEAAMNAARSPAPATTTPQPDPKKK